MLVKRMAFATLLLFRFNRFAFLQRECQARFAALSQNRKNRKKPHLRQPSNSLSLLPLPLLVSPAYGSTFPLMRLVSCSLWGHGHRLGGLLLSLSSLRLFGPFLGLCARFVWGRTWEPEQGREESSFKSQALNPHSYKRNEELVYSVPRHVRSSIIQAGLPCLQSPHQKN